MKKLLSMLIIIFMLMNVNLNAYAKANDFKDEAKLKTEYVLDNEYKKSFLVFETSNITYSINNETEYQRYKNPNMMLVLNFLFPGLGHLAVGEYLGGSILITLALIPVLFFVGVVIVDSKGWPLERGWGTFGALLISVPIYFVIYIINLIVSGFFYRDLHEKNEFYKKITQRKK